MAIWDFIRNVVSGRIKHWNQTNNPVIAGMWRRAEAFNPPFDTIFKQFVVSAGTVVDVLIGPDTKPNDVLSVDIREMDRLHFRSLYSALLAYFVFYSSASTPFLREQLETCLAQVAPEPKVAQSLLGNLRALDPKEHNRIAGELWRTVVDVAGFGSETNPGQLVVFSMTALNAHLEAIKAIRPKIDFELM